MLMKNGIQDRMHTGVFDQLGSGSRSKGESQSISLVSWRSGIGHWALTKQKHAADINDCD